MYVYMYVCMYVCVCVCVRVYEGERGEEESRRPAKRYDVSYASACPEMALRFASV